jgi:hypothetical protein
MKKIYLRWLVLLVIGLMPLSAASIGYAQESTPTHPLYFPILRIPYRMVIPFVNSYYPMSPYTGVVGGIIPAIAFDPFTSRIVYAASWDGGVYKSYDSGETWVQANQGMPTVQINTIAADPRNPGVLYAGPYRYGIYKSTNGGVTWTSCNVGIQKEAVVYSIAVDTFNPNIVYASTRNYNNPFYSPWQGILYKSIDGGASWSPSLTNAGGAGEQDWVYSIAIDLHNPNTVYAAAHETGAYRSSDYGVTWQSIDNGIIDKTGRSIVIDKTTTDPLTVYMGTWHETGVYKSTDGGSSWRTASRGMASPKIYSLTMDPNDNSTLYAATINDGIYKTIDAGKLWFGAGFNDQFFYTVAVDPHNSQYLLAGARTKGLFKSQDGGGTWAQINMGFTTSGGFASLEELPVILGDPR